MIKLKWVIFPIVIFFILTSFTACTNSVPTTITSISYHSAKYNMNVQISLGWVGIEGPTNLKFPGIEGLVAFNSWGQTDFWAKAESENNTGGPISFHYSPAVVASQIPGGGAYIALVEEDGPPYIDEKPVEYTGNDLSGLYQSHDWRQDSADEAYFKNFYKGGLDLTLVVACSPNASDQTIAQINDLLKSWRFGKAATTSN